MAEQDHAPLLVPGAAVAFQVDLTQGSRARGNGCEEGYRRGQPPTDQRLEHRATGPPSQEGSNETIESAFVHKAPSARPRHAAGTKPLDSPTCRFETYGSRGAESLPSGRPSPSVS